MVHRSRRSLINKHYFLTGGNLLYHFTIFVEPLIKCMVNLLGFEFVMRLKVVCFLVFGQYIATVVPP